MSKLELVLILASVAIIAVGQIMFKLAAQHITFDSQHSLLVLAKCNIYSILLTAVALFLYMTSTVAWIYALRTVPLSIAFLFNALAFIFVPILSTLILHEDLPRLYWLGVLLILGGIASMSFS